MLSIKEAVFVSLLLLVSISSLCTIHASNDVFTLEFMENPKLALAKNITPREVATTYPYKYEDMLLDIGYLKVKYPDIIKIETVGYSEWGFPIWSIILGKGAKKVMINGAHHAREYATTSVLMKMVNYYAQLYDNDESVEPYGRVRDILNQVSIYFIPVVNPDGVRIAQNDLKYISREKIEQLQSMLLPGATFANWKANGNGVDLNSNYPARWKKSIFTYSYQNSSGRYPAEAKEVQALMEYTKKNDFLSTISYHCAGEVIYWYFYQNKNNMERDLKLSQQLSAITGYSLLPIAIQIRSHSGYKDWYIQEFKRPAWTIEIGKTVNEQPLSKEEMLDAWDKNKYVGLWLAKMVLDYGIK